MRAVLLACFVLFATVESAAAQQCDPAYANACVSLTATVDPSAVVLSGADIGDLAVVGPNVQVGAGVIGVRATLTGRVSGALVQPFGDNAILSRGAFIGADADIGEDVLVGRNVVVGRGLVAGPNATVGYASSLGDDVVLGVGSTIGNLVTVGDRSVVTGVIGRDVTVGDDADVDGVVGPGVTIGNGAVVDGRVRKNAVLGALTQVDAGARIGRGAVIGSGVILGDNVKVGTNANVPDCAWLAGPETVGNGQTWAGTTFVSGCVAEGLSPIRSSVSAGVRGSVRDTAGNLYVVGAAEADASYAGMTLATAPAGKLTAFVTKFDPQMNVVWNTPFNGTDHTSLNGVAIVGNILYVGGYFGGTLTAGSETLASVDSNWLVGGLAADTGVVQWVRTAVNGAGSVADLVADASGVTAGGSYSGGTDFGGGVTLPNTTDRDAAIVRYDMSGAAQWARRAGAYGSDGVTDMAKLPNGNLAVALYANGATKSLGSDFTSTLSGCSWSCTVLAIVDPFGMPVADHSLAQTGAHTIPRRLTQEGGRIFMTASTANGGIPFAGGVLTSPVSGARCSHILEFTSSAVPVQSWSPTGSVTSPGLEVHNGVLYAAYNSGSSVTFGTTVVSHPGSTGDWEYSNGDYLSVLAALDVNTGAWLWARSLWISGPSGAPDYGYPDGGLNRIAVFDDGGVVKLTSWLQVRDTDTLHLNGQAVPVGDLSGAILLQSSTGPSWGL